MKKKHMKPMGTIRDAPRSAAWLCSDEAFKVLCGNGYTRLSDCPEVRMCVHAYADMISSMTIYLMQNTAVGDVRVNNGLARRLDVEPNRYMTRKQLIYTIVSTMMLDGDGNQITIPRYQNGLLTELMPMPPSATSMIDSPGEDGYRIVVGKHTFKPDEVLHFAMMPDPNRPWRGTGYAALMRDVLKALRQSNATKQALLESPTPSLIVKVDGLTEEFASKEGRTKLGEQFLDDSENGRPWFIPAETISVEQVKPLTLNDLAIAKNQELDKRTIASMFGVPPYMVGVGAYNRDEYNNFVNTRVMPLARIIEQEMTRKLLWAQDLYIRFNPRSLYAYSLDEIVAAGGAMVDRMAMRRNEWREWIGMSPDADMTELLALENYIPADRLGDQKKLGGGKADE